MARRTRQQTEKSQALDEEVKPAASASEPAEALASPSQTNKPVSHGEMLLHWVTEGYEIGQLVGDLRGKKNIEPYFEEFQRRVKRAAEIIAEIEVLGTVPPVRVEALRAIAKEPARLAELEKELSDWRDGPKLKEMKAEFMSLNIKGFEDAARVIQGKFSDPSKRGEIEKDIHDLKHKIKERFFEQEFAVHLEPVPETSAHPLAETIFIIHRDGTLLSVKSKQSKEQVDKKALSHMVIEIRERMSKGSKECFDADGSRVIMENGQHVCVAVAFKGDELPIMRKVIDKVVQIMERKNAAVFSNWTGDRARLIDMERYPTALFQALEQMEKKE
ncbi:MAG: hypothetical protein V1934_09205 [Methanobacteriota archaeon]